MEHLTKRKGSINWYYREAVPQDVRAILIARGDKAPVDVWRSLGTPDLKAAKLAMLRVRAEQHRDWDALRDDGAKSGAIPTITEMAEVALDVIHARFIEVHKEQLRAKFSRDADIEGELRSRKATLVQASFLPSESDAVAIEKLAAAICRKKGWDLRHDTIEGAALWSELLRFVTKAVQLARSAIVNELEGRPAENAREVVLSRLGVSPSRKAAPGASIIELFDLYTAVMLRRKDKSADTLNADRKVIEQFAGFVGADRDLGSISKPEVRDFRNALSQVPVKWTSRTDLRQLTLREAANHWRTAGGPVRSQKTVAKELSGLSAFYSWCVREGYAEDNPTRDLAPKIDRKEGKYPTYTQEQLGRIFASPLFTGCQPSEGEEHLPGPTLIRDWRYWLPLCALYSGARAGEIAQLGCSDVRQEDGTWVFDFNETHDEETSVKSLKTEASRRLVPVHPVLMCLGFLDHVATVRATGSRRVFPDIQPCARGTLSYQPSRFWQRYLKRMRLKTRGLALHSFRHTFADECRQHGVSDAVLGSILGHSKQTITAHYGQTTEGSLSQRSAAIEAVSYDNLHSSDASNTLAA